MMDNWRRYERRWWDGERWGEGGGRHDECIGMKLDRGLLGVTQTQDKGIPPDRHDMMQSVTMDKIVLYSGARRTRPKKLNPVSTFN